MRDFFINLLNDEKGAPYIEIFNIWHILVLLFTIGIIVLLNHLFRNKSDSTKKRLLDIIAASIIGLYLSDFLTHPLIEKENLLIVDKLPFHLCTSVCLIIVFSRLFPKWCIKWYHVPAILGLAGGILYLAYPIGVDGDSLFCYRSLQTLIYHGTLIVYGVLSITLGEIKISFKNFVYFPIVIAIQILISVIANKVYTIPDGHSYNWYFSLSDPVGIGIPEWLEPIIVLASISLLVAIIYGVVYLVRKLKHK